MNHRLTRMTALRRSLTRIHETSERLRIGAVLSGPAGYLSAFPCLFSISVNRAFCFKNVAQAGEAKPQFTDLLAKYHPVLMAKGASENQQNL
jgi:hypothetical protein